MTRKLIESFFLTVGAFLVIIVPVALVGLIFYMFGETYGTLILVFLFVWWFFLVLRINYDDY